MLRRNAPLSKKPSSTPAPSGAWDIDIEPGILHQISGPSRYFGIPADCKHVSGAYCPTDGCIYFTAGDYPGGSGMGTGVWPRTYGVSYRQETWKLDLAAWVNAGAGNNPGWTLMTPYEGYGGVSVQPKDPDYVGWVWDNSRQVFWFVPGTMVRGEPGNRPPGETSQGAGEAVISDTNFRYFEMMKFAPFAATPETRWSTLGVSAIPPYPGTAPSINDNTWFTLYNDLTDTLIRPRRAPPMVVDRFDCATSAWELVGAANGVGGTARPVGLYEIAAGASTSNEFGKEYHAFDPVSRWVYAVSGVANKLHRWHIDSHFSENLGNMPYPPLAPTYFPIPKENYSYCTWDTVNSVLVHFETYSRRLCIYTPATATWEVPLLAQSPISGALIGGRNFFYDPGNNVHVIWGGAEDQQDVKWHLYRYGG